MDIQMLPTIETWLLALCSGVASVGYGSGCARLLRIHPNLGDRGILGLLVLGFFGCILHFAVALSTPIQTAVLAGGVTISAIFWRDIRSDASLGLAAAAGLCIFQLLHPQALGNYDQGLYYLQTFKWNHEFPIVAGLGNLHGRLAYNSILFLIAPLLDRIEIGWISNLLVATFVMLSLWARLQQIKLGGSHGRMHYWFLALVILVMVSRASGLAILRADSIAAVLIVYWVALALGFSRAEDQQSDFALLVTSAVLAAAVKITTAPLIILTMALYWFYRKDRIVGAAPICSFAAATLAAWMLRGVLLSGCAVYPVRLTCFPGVSWAVPLQQVADEAMAIRSWARRPFEPDFPGVLQDWSWLSHWFGLASNNRIMGLLLAGCLVGVVAVVFTSTKAQRQARGDLALISVGIAACLGFWFWSAPDVRFGAGFILSAALLGISLGAAACLHQPYFYSYASRALVLLMVLFGINNLVHLDVESFVFHMPEADVYQLQTTLGKRVWVPRTDYQCWAHDLPCTPYINLDVLDRVRWPVSWPYSYDQKLTPPQGWTPAFGVYPKSH